MTHKPWTSKPNLWPLCFIAAVNYNYVNNWQSIQNRDRLSGSKTTDDSAQTWPFDPIELSFWKSASMIDGSENTTAVWVFNPLSPNSDKNEISLHIITTCSNVQVMRIKKVITKDKMCWYLDKLSLLIP